MKLSVTGSYLREKLLENPSWLKSHEISQYSEIEITTYANLSGLKITTLDHKNIKFCGLDPATGLCAELNNCLILEKISAHFEGNVSIQNSGLKTTDGISINPNGVSPNGYVANFDYCFNLKVAQGDWPGAVSYAYSSIEKIENLHIERGNTQGVAANFKGCANLTEANGVFPSMVDFSESGVERSNNLQVMGKDKEGNAAKFIKCTKLLVAEGYYSGGVFWDNSIVNQIDSKNLTILCPNNENIAASFQNCQNIDTAKGNYPGILNLQNSSIKRLGKLNFHNCHTKPLTTIILTKGCNNLKEIPMDINLETISADNNLIEKYILKKNRKNILSGKLPEDEALNI
jgi:hypothetical protein